MTDLGEIFAELGISHYLDDFIEQGFDTWDTILDITESDFDALNVKLGHRRKLQRKIAQSRGLSSDRALASPSRNTPTDDRPVDETKGGGHKADANTSSGGTQGAKRKYRRHPKPDENAPERPPSAYVIFSNKMREDLKGRPLSFTEIAKLVGENWQNLAAHEREPYEQQAFTAKEKYNAELVEYKKTEQYKEYSQYLIDFKARQSHQHQGKQGVSQADVDVAKRPKLEPQVSTTSTGTTSSGASLHGNEPPSGRKREDSATTNGSWPVVNRQLSPPSQSPILPKLTSVYGGAQLSPNPTSPTVLPGYRESMYGGGTPQQRPRREGHRDETVYPLHPLPRMSEPSDIRMAFDRPNVGDSLNLAGSIQHTHRTGQNHPPPLLTSDSTSGATISSGSSASTNSSTYFPRTPMEPSVDRALPVPSIYSQKPYELPPLRPPSLSPQTSVLNTQQSPHGIPPIGDFSNAMAPMRGHIPLNSRQQRPSAVADAPDDTELDPVSALLKAVMIQDVYEPQVPLLLFHRGGRSIREDRTLHKTSHWLRTVEAVTLFPHSGFGVWSIASALSLLYDSPTVYFYSSSSTFMRAIYATSCQNLDQNLWPALVWHTLRDSGTTNFFKELIGWTLQLTLFSI